jgi:hypothetical protein
MDLHHPHTNTHTHHTHTQHTQTHLHPAHTRRTHILTNTHSLIVTMSTASTARPPAKRVRIDNDTPPVFDYTPIAGAVSTLLPAMREFVKHYYDKFIKTCKKIYDKEKIITKLRQPDFIPRSARSNFKLGASETVKLSTDYTTLERSVENVKNAFEKRQKAYILQSAQLEMKVLNNEKDAIFIEGLFKISSMIYLWKTDIEPDIDEVVIHHVIKDMLRKDSTLLTHVFDCKYTTFATQYNTVYPLSINIIHPAGINVDPATDIDIDEIPAADAQATMDQFYPRVSVAAATTTTNNLELLNTQDNATATTLATTTTNTQDTQDMDNVQYEELPMHHILPESELMRLLRILKEVFVTNWSTEKRKLENKLVEAKMAKFIKSTLINKATDDAAAVVAAEPAAEMQQLNQLIEKKVEEKTKKLQKELQTTIQQLKRAQQPTAVKNTNRGETNTRAGQNKSKRNRRQRSTSTNTRSQSPRNNNRNNKSATGTTNNRNSKTNSRTNNNNNDHTPRRSRSRRPRSTSNNSNKNSNANNNNNETTQRHNRKNKKVGDAQRDTRENNASSRSNKNNKGSKSKKKNSSTGRGRQNKQQN